MTDKEAITMALEALEYIDDGANNQGAHIGISWRCVSTKAKPAIAALKARLAQPEPIQSLQCFHCQVTIETLNDKVMQLMAQRTEPICPDCKAEVLYECVACSSNNYPPPQRTEQEPVAWTADDMAYRPSGLPQDFIRHEVESVYDWSDWVCPSPEQYFMKCCDCGLVHEMQFKVAKYKLGNECEFVEDTNLQAVFKARRTHPPQRTEQEPVAWINAEKRTFEWNGPVLWNTPTVAVLNKIPLYTHPPQRTWVDLSNEDIEECFTITPDLYLKRHIAQRISDKLKEKNNG